MPVNSFENYFMSWEPLREELSYPKYRSIAELLERDIADGKLHEHLRLPPQRELADFLDVNLSTVTKAYKICELKGLVYAVVGRGTFVSPNAGHSPSVVGGSDSPLIEMGIVLPFQEHNDAIREIASAVLQSSFSKRCFEYGPPSGNLPQLRVARQWLNRFHVHADEENILVCSGAQNALAVILASMFRAGEGIATDPHTYPNFVGLANMLDIRLSAVKNDDSGMLPEELERLCRSNRIRGVYLMPSRNNPTNVAMNEARRREIAQIAETYNLLLIEDDIYAFLSEKLLLPFASILPERTVYVSGVSKPLCAGVRVAYMAFPEWCRTTLRRGLYNLNLQTPALNIEIVTEAIRCGIDVEITEKKRSLARARNVLFENYFPQPEKGRDSETYFRWLPLPHGCSGKSFELQAEKRGIRLFGSERFAVGEASGHAVRLVVSSPRNDAELERGLFILKELYDEYGKADGNAWIV